MAKDRNSFQILLVLCSYQTVFPFAVCVEFLCPSFTQSIFLLFYTSYELVLQLNHRLYWGKSQETRFQRFNCHYRIPFKPYLSPLPFWGSGRLTGRSWVLFVKQETRLYILSLWTGLGKLQVIHWWEECRIAYLLLCFILSQPGDGDSCQCISVIRICCRIVCQLRAWSGLFPDCCTLFQSACRGKEDDAVFYLKQFSPTERVGSLKFPASLLLQ